MKGGKWHYGKLWLFFWTKFSPAESPPPLCGGLMSKHEAKAVDKGALGLEMVGISGCFGVPLQYRTRPSSGKKWNMHRL